MIYKNPEVEALAAYRSPDPIDYWYASRGRVVDIRHEPIADVQRILMGPQMRAHLATFEPAPAGGYRAVSYARSPWTVVKAQYRNGIKRCSLFVAVGTAAPNFTYNDQGNSARTCIFANPGATQSNVWPNRGQGDTNPTLRYGSNATAAADTDTNIGTQLGADITGTVAYDDVLHQTNVSGSRVHTEANATIREIAILMNYPHNAGAAIFLIDHTIIADTAVATGQTVAVSYQCQF